MKKIQVTIRKDGTQKVEVLGAVGTECEALTRELERRLGTADGERTLKEAYHQAVIDTEVERQRLEEGAS